MEGLYRYKCLQLPPQCRVHLSAVGWASKLPPMHLSQHIMFVWHRREAIGDFRVEDAWTVEEMVEWLQKPAEASVDDSKQ